MQVPRWRYVFISKNSLTPCSIRAAISSSSHFASFHSTPVASEKWKNKWNHDFTSHQPSKNYIRYASRQKRADARRALKDLLFNNGSPKFSFQDEDSTWKIDGASSWDEEADHSDSSNKKGRPKSSNRRGRKAQHNRFRRKFRKDYFSEDDYSPETIFHATFGNRNKWCTWSFNSAGSSSFQSSTSAFEWRGQSNGTNNRNKEWDTASETESDGESCVVGSYSDRRMLGLPPTGPLKIEDVKNAFRLSALKWHPDKHQGPSQATAEEKFKLCVNAYKSLCNALSTV